MLQGRVYGMRGRELKGRAPGAARALRPGRGRRPHGAHLLRRHAAQARRGRRPHAPAAGAVPRRADDRSRPGGARGHVVRDRAPGRRRGPDHPADDALPGGGRQPRAAAGHRRPRAQSSPRARPTSSRASCAATPSSWSSRSAAGRRGPPGARGVPDLRDVVVEARTLRARADSGARTVPAVLAALEAPGVGVAAVTVARPSLDDVYLRHAGRAFCEDDAEVKQAMNNAIADTLVHDRAALPQPAAPAGLDPHLARAAGGVAAALRRPVPQDRRDPRVRGRLATSTSSRRASSS